MKIQKAGYHDIEEILNVQYMAFMSQANQTKDYSIEPLHQTLSQAEEEFEKGIFLKAVDDFGNILGSVRGIADDLTVYISKLFVHPGIQNSGLGSNLLLNIEKMFDVSRAELFTNSSCKKNFNFYINHGYCPFKTEFIPSKAEKFDFTFFEKYF